MIDRQSGVFNPQTSDRINIKSTALWEKIQGINAPVIYPKLQVDADDIGWQSVSGIAEVSNTSFTIGGNLHIVNYRITLTRPMQLTNNTIGLLRFPPNGDIIVSFNDGAYIAIVRKGTAQIKVTTADTVQQLQVYFTYVT